MTEGKMSPLRQRIIEEMRIRGMGDKARMSHIRAIRDFSAFPRHSPDQRSCAPTSFTEAPANV